MQVEFWLPCVRLAQGCEMLALAQGLDGTAKLGGVNTSVEAKASSPKPPYAQNDSPEDTVAVGG
mgnify:CR=1 FL=1